MIYTLRSGRFFFKGMSKFPELSLPLPEPQYVFGWGASKKFWSYKEARFQSNYLSGVHNHETEVESLLKTFKRKHIDPYDLWVLVKNVFR